MRILHVNFAPFHEGPQRAGGIAGYMQNLAFALQTGGHQVGAMSTGSTYTPSVCGGAVGLPAWRELKNWRGVDRLEIINSPNLAPALWQFANAPAESENADLDSIFSEILRSWKPDIVHIHSLEGLAASCIDVAKHAGCRVVMSLHNHHPYCPQVYLMRGRRMPCLDYEGGLACENCEESIDIASEKRRRAGTKQTHPPSIDPPLLPPILRFIESGAMTDESMKLLQSEQPLYQSLYNDPPEAEAARCTNNSFGIRRKRMVESLNSCDRVLAVSDFVRRLAVSMGVDETRVLTQPIGTRSEKKLQIRQPRNDGVLRMVFLGFNNYYKGLAMLVDSIGLLRPELRSRIHLAAYGPGCTAIRERAEAIRPALSALELGGSYSRVDLPTLLAGYDIGIVPSVWWDNGPQTLMEFQAHGLPVLASNLGGIPDRVVHDVNGLLFTGNDRADAAKQIERLLVEPDLLSSLWQHVEGGPSIEDHAQEVIRVYEQMLELR